MSSPEFIETKGSLDRVNKVLNGIRSGNPILLEGETGTSKTKTAYEACLKNNQEPIIFNFSSQTTIEDLIGRITKDTNSWGGFSFSYGPYTKAFKYGHCLILDEINLAYENVLQCIEASLDSGKLFLETEVIPRHHNFHIIATQNPLKGRFSQKRQFLSQKFRSLFQIINFVDITKEELLEIAIGLSKNSSISTEVIGKLIDFHFEWKKIAEKENQIHVFTIREISGTIKSMKEGLPPYISILIHYGSRYNKEKLNEMIKILNSFGFLPSDEKLKLPPIDKDLFYMTHSIERAVLNSIHLLQTYHPILITGPDGCGKTSFARWISHIYNQITQNQNEEKSIKMNEKTEQKEQTETTEEEERETNDQLEQKEETEQNETSKQDGTSEQSQDKEKEENKSSSQTTNVFICNPEVSISDIIGRYMPVMGAVGEAPIMWVDGPVVKSLRNGDCLIMDQIDIAPSTILERMNPICDSFGIKDARFPVQENSEEDSIPIHPNARIIATSSLDGLYEISPALLNRFTIIHIDDQLNQLFSDKEMFIDFINFLAPKSSQKSDIKLIAELIIRNRTEMTMSRISLIVKGFFNIKKIFPRAISKSVLEFCVSATSHKIEIPTMDDTFVSLLLASLNEDNTDMTFDTFLFKEANATRKIMAALVAASIAGFHVVLIGKTGLGKTSAAIALSRLSKFSQGRQFISFNGETQLEELFGFFTIEKGQFTSHAGPLSDAMENGKYFIADELNLADQMIIQSLNVAIEPSKNEQIILPVIGKNINIHENFFFIGCQNDVSMYGRKPLPESFQKKVLCINYLENSYTDLNSLTRTLALQFKLDPNVSNGITDMIENMKKDSVFKKKVWSLREVRKLFRRTEYISNHKDIMSGFTIQTNAAFLLRSAFRDIEGISDKVAELVSNSFKLNKSDSNNLLKNLNTEVNVMKIYPKDQVHLGKNRLSVTILNRELLKVPEGLQSFWQTLFEVVITHPAEPLLFVGPSGFKTYLAKMVSPLSPVVYLHSDTTISSLIGQITLLDKNQARQFLLDSLYGFAGPAPKDEYKELFKEIRVSEVIDIDRIKEVLKYINNPSFTNIVENVIQQLIDIDYSQEATSAFSNYLSIFKPGLITKYILKQNSLILRNIAQPSPTVLERLNELLSVTPTLTLFEDTSNTFTTADEKIVSRLSNNFRIIGICSTREKRGLSDAMQSRLTEISVPEYTNEDQEKVIDSILLQSELNNDKSINLYKKLLNKASQIFIEKKEVLSMSIPFIRIIEMVRIATSWRKFFNKYEKVESEEELFSLALFRCTSGPLPFNNKKLFIDSFYNESSGLTLNKELKKIFEQKQDEEIISSVNDLLTIDEIEDQRILRSTLSNCFVPTPLSELPEIDICITPSMKDLIDVIISASMINYPLILEGPNGSGKSSAFFYLSKCVDANVVRISISSSTTVEDLFGKYEPNTSSESLKFDFQPTNFLNAIRSDRNLENNNNNQGFSALKKQWIIIEELHLASASVFDSLAPVFNKQTNQIVLTDGTVIAKGDFFIVGLVSQPLQNQSIINSSMIYKTRDYTKEEYEQIYKFILSKNNFNDEITYYFSNQMYKLAALSATSQFKIPVTTREAYKFLNLYDGSEGKMGIDKIIRTLCLGRFTDNEFVVNAKEELGYNDDNYKPPEVSVEMGSLSLKSGEIPMRINPSLSQRQYDVQYLTSSEKELFVFLSMTMKKYTPVIVQGPTASGKTYAVQLYADIIGKKLRTIQLNSEITSQTIAGTFQPSNSLSQTEMEKLKDVLHTIADLPGLPQEFASKIENEELNAWSPKDFKKLRLIMQKSMDQFNPSEQEKAKLFIKKVDNLLQFYNHLKRIDSVIINTMVEGHWLLLDGIEAAPSDFFDRLYTLIDDKPLLNLYERGNGFIYSYDSPNPERRIHPDFRLIMTYNPVDISFSNSLSTSILSRCTIYSMNAIDNDINDSSLVIFGFLNPNDFKNMDEDSSELSIKLGKTHMAAKKIASNSQFSITGRSLIHLCHNLEYKSEIEDIDFTNLKSAIKFNYGSLMDDPDKFIDDVDEIFEQVIDVKFLEFIKKAQLSTSKSCIEIINLIDNFINLIKENIQNVKSDFEFDKFLGLLLQLHLKDIETVYDKVRYTFINYLRQLIIDIKTKNIEINTEIIKFFAHCSAIRCLEILVNDIRRACQESSDNELSKNVTLSSPQIQQIPQFQVILKKIRCMIILIQKNVFVLQSLPILFFENSRSDFLSILEKIDNKEPIKELFDAISQLKNNENAKLFVNFQENPIYFLDSMIHFYTSNNWPEKVIKSTSNMIASCLFFNNENCKFLFRGISRDFYIALHSLLNNNESDINLFIDLIDYVGNFYQYLEVDSSINLEELNSCFEKRSKSDQQQFKKFFQNLRTINNKSPLQNNSYESIDSSQLQKITSIVDKLYQEFNTNYSILYLQRQKDQDAAKEFYQLIENINNRLESEDELKLPLELYVKLTYDMDINSDNFAFLKQIYSSIKPAKEVVINNFEWPKDYVIKFSNETTSFPLMDSLINYSKKAQIDFKTANWMTLCSIEKNAEFFLTQFLSNEIAQESIELYNMNIKAQLLYELFKFGSEKDSTKKYAYCSRDSIINFLNENFDRKRNYNQTFVDLAHYYELNMDRDFIINIPTFDYNDIISLIINPIDNSSGPLFNDTKTTPEDYEYIKNYCTSLDDKKKLIIYDLAISFLKYNGIAGFEENESFEDVHQYVISKGSIEIHIQDTIQALFNAYQISKVALNDTNSVKLLFTDIPYDLNAEFIDANPFSGFYLCFHQEVKHEISLIHKLIGESSYPLSLFAFREYTQRSIIEIKLPSTFPSNLSHEVEEFIILIKNTVIENIKNGKISKFSNLIGFLLNQAPMSLDTQQSEHFREILLDILSKQLNPIFTKYIMKYLNEKIEEYILILGSNKWNQLIKTDFTKTDNKFLLFLINPWDKIMNSILQDFKQEKKNYGDKIQEIFDKINRQFTVKYNNRSFFNKLLDAKKKDEIELQTKIREDFIRLNGPITNESTESPEEQELHRAWKAYCSFTLNMVNKIEEFPGVSSAKVFPYEASFIKFHEHLSKYSSFSYPTCDQSITLIVIIPKEGKKEKEIKISYTRGKDQVDVIGKIKEISIVKLPQNKSISDLNLKSNDATFYYDTVFMESSVQPRKYFKMNEMEDAFNKYKISLSKNSKQTEDSQFGRVVVTFNNHTFEEFQKKIEDLYNDININLGASYSLRILSESSARILTKIKEIDDYFPAKFPEEVETPTETNSNLEQFKNFVSTFEHDLSEIHISQELIEADDLFDINKGNDFNKIRKSVEKFASDPKPKLSGDTTRYSDSEFKIIKSLDKLAIPTIFMDESQFCLNINHLHAKLGPYYKGGSYTPLKIRIINLTKESISCVYHQDNAIIDPYYENENGFFTLLFPVDKIAFDYNGNTELQFTGRIEFKEPNSENSFKEITYDISILYLSPNIYFKVTRYPLAIKDGEAQVLPYYAIQNSKLCFETVPATKQIKIIELPDNTAKKPIKNNSSGKNIITLPSKDPKNQDNYFSAQFDFGMSNSVPVPITLNAELKENNAHLYVYCDKAKTFIENGAYISIGNLSRDVYILISYFNPLNKKSYATIEFSDLNSEYIDISKIGEIELPEYQRTVKILSFKVKLFKIPNERPIVNYSIQLKTSDVTVKNEFYFILDKIFVDSKINKISTNRYFKCSYYDGTKFIEYKKGEKFVSDMDYTILVSPISYYFNQKESSNLISVKYDTSGEFLYHRNKTEFEALILDPQIEGEDQIQIIDLNKCKQIEGRPIRLFARIKGKPNTVFPIFGLCSWIQKDFTASSFDGGKNEIIDEFLNWFEQLLPDHDRNHSLLSFNDKSFITGDLPSAYNYAYLISYLAPFTMQLQYQKNLKKISEFVNSEIIINKYNTIYSKLPNDINLKFINFIWSLYETMKVSFDEIKVKHFTVEFPIPFERILEEQNKYIKENRLDESSALQSSTYKNLMDHNNIEDFNNKNIEKFKKDGYEISTFAKWTFENKFQEITEDEYPQGDNSVLPEYTNEIKPDYSDESGNIDIPDVSFNNMSTILDTYKAFDSILKNAYQYTISINYCLMKKDDKQLHHNVEILNQLVSFFLWAKKIKDYSPYPSFFSRFFSAYQSMMSRLKSAGMGIRKEHLLINELQLNKMNDDFIERPGFALNFEAFSFQWKQLGKNKKQEQKEVENKIQPSSANKRKRNTHNKRDQDRIEDDFSKYTGHLVKGAKDGNPTHTGEINKKMSRTSEEVEEVPNQDYIDYIVDRMINPTKEKKSINIFNDDKSHIPEHYNISNEIQMPVKKVDYFFSQAETLSASILNNLGSKSKVFDNCDNCYASILVDCSNTFSLVQKASLILLTISYGNALTALRIPYSIVIFCDDNFQFILKKLEDEHDRSHYLKLIEAMTVNRRMASMSDAIQMAKMKIIPTGTFASRTNHVIYTLSDGLTTTLNITKQWRENVLNSNLVTVSFFFLNIISGDASQEILEIWSKFAKEISIAQSPTTVFYSTFENIIKNKDFYIISTAKNQEELQLSKLVTLSECFGRPIIQSVPQTALKPTIKILKKLDNFNFNDKILGTIIDKLNSNLPDESKYYRDVSYDIQAYEPIEVEIPSIKVEPFSTNLVMNDTQTDRSIYNQFTNDLYKLSSTMIEQSNVQEMTSYIFEPNKPSQYAPSSDGTLFYFPGLIRFLLTQGQDTKIFLEKKAGLIKSYSVFIVIDCTTSCFNNQSSYHAFQSIFSLLQTISKIDLPSFNLIITTNDGPRILCSEKSTLEALSQYSSIWFALFSSLLNPHENSCLDSALLYLLAMRSQEKTLSSVLFLFTDGNYSNGKVKVFNSILESISSYNVETVTIGIGSLSSNITSLATKKVWSVNPRNTVKAILSVFGKESSDLIHEIVSLYQMNPVLEDDLKKVELDLSACLEYSSIDDYLLKELITELNSITREISVFTDFYNIQPDGSEVLSEEASYDLGKKNFYTGINILICQFWDESMSYNENEFISKEVLINGIDKKHISVINALKEFGIATKIVQNYKDAIEGIKSGEFSQVWVICGRYDGRMPDKSQTGNLMSQFIEVLIIYWNNGGGLVFWTDNAPLDAEVNFFLSKATFNNDQTVNFRIGGDYPGLTMLRKSENPKKSTFRAQKQIQCDGYNKLLFNANMKMIYEGISIASAIIPPENARNECYDSDNKGHYQFAFGDDIHPFEYFSISSSGGISSLYYNSPLNSTKGDIVIDCGFSKLFFELTTEGIYYYVRNIAIFMLSLEKKSSMIGGGADPRKIKPKKFEYMIHPYAAPNPSFYIYNYRRAVDIVFLIDGTGSMRFLINAVISSCNDIAQVCKEKFSDNEFRFGAIIYRDNAVSDIRCDMLKYRYYRDETEYSPLNTDIRVLQKFLSEVEPRGGGNDGPEDWLSGYERLKKMNWNKISEKVVIHIADAPSHGSSFNHKDYKIPYFTSDEAENKKQYEKMDKEHDRLVPEVLKWAAAYGIRFFCLSGGYRPSGSFKKAKKIFDDANGKLFNITELEYYSNDIDEEQKKMILKVVRRVALQSVDSAVAVKGKTAPDQQLQERNRQTQRHTRQQPQPQPQQHQQKKKQNTKQRKKKQNTDNENSRPSQSQQQQRPPPPPMRPPQPNEIMASTRPNNRKKPNDGKNKEFVSASKYFNDSDD